VANDLEVGEPIRNNGPQEGAYKNETPPGRAKDQILDPLGNPVKKDTPAPVDTSSHQAQIKDLQDRLTKTGEELFSAQQKAKEGSIPDDVRADPERLLEYYGLGDKKWDMISKLIGEDAAEELKGNNEGPAPDPEKQALQKRLDALEKDAERGRVLEAKAQLRKILSDSETEVLGALGDEGIEALYSELERYVAKYKELPEGEAWTRTLQKVDQDQKASALSTLKRLSAVPALKAEMKKMLGVRTDAVMDASDPASAVKSAEQSLNSALLGFNPDLREQDTGRQSPKTPNPANMDDIVKGITTLAQARTKRR